MVVVTRYIARSLYFEQRTQSCKPPITYPLKPHYLSFKMIFGSQVSGWIPLRLAMCGMRETGDCYGHGYKWMLIDLHLQFD